MQPSTGPFYQGFPLRELGSPDQLHLLRAPHMEEVQPEAITTSEAVAFANYN